MTDLHRGVVEHTDGVARGNGEGQTVPVGGAELSAAGKYGQGDIDIVADIHTRIPSVEAAGRLNGHGGSRRRAGRSQGGECRWIRRRIRQPRRNAAALTYNTGVARYRYQA